MKFCFPYWWLTRTRDQTKDVFFDYVKRRHALAKATTNRTNVSCIAPTDSPKGDDALNWIYGLLTILDAKASALMRLNGVMLAAAAFLDPVDELANVHGNRPEPADGKRRTIQRQRRDDRVDAAAIRQPGVHHRRRLVDTTAHLRDHLVDDPP